MDILIRTLKNTDKDMYIVLIKKLWNDIKDAEIDTIMMESYQGKHTVYVAEYKNKIIGFLNTSHRTDYVEGTSSSPVGYIEGVYVEETYRHNHVAKNLIYHAIEAFNKQGILEVASDVEIDNKASLKFHDKIGFKEVSTIKHFVFEKE